MTGWVVTLKLGKLKDNLFLIHCCSHLIYPNFYLFIYSCFFTAAAWASVCACVFFRHTCQSVPVFFQDWKAFHLRKSIKFLGFFHSFFFSFLQVKHCCASAAAAAKRSLIIALSELIFSMLWKQDQLDYTTSAAGRFHLNNRLDFFL